ncbi:uncharacterized protein [Montipora capricornis]|uniref:uncharacterized protein n=1 Tax=Montipora capricornis TaxID=246305 RepID=UPI0035F16062
MKILFVFSIFVVICQLINKTETQQCPAFGSEESILGWMLQGHIYQTMMANIGLHCLSACLKDDRCQSFNFVMSLHMCEFSDRTKEARPEDFIPNADRYYFRKYVHSVPLGSISELAAESCKEIKMSEGRSPNGKYWISTAESLYSFSKFLLYCDMTTSGQTWTLTARFSNNDSKNWMIDSGKWWYDKNVEFGETANPSSNTDMISQAFWLVSGQEFKITRSDDPQHTALLQTTGDCLGGQTFRTKITSYGDFRNGRVWASDRCLGNCRIQYGGQYDTTDGFEQASCNGNATQIGFWCDWSGDGAVLMIGGGGATCNRADHGIGITEANQASFVAPPLNTTLATELKALELKRRATL